MSSRRSAHPLHLIALRCGFGRSQLSDLDRQFIHLVLGLIRLGSESGS
jgi:hypothetical protein